jgi:hypothetical protein
MALPQYVQIAFNTPVGKASDFSFTRDGGVVIFPREELPVDQAKMAADLPDFLRFVRQQRSQEAVELWFQREASEALGNIPALQREAPSRPPMES